MVAELTNLVESMVAQQVANFDFVVAIVALVGSPCSTTATPDLSEMLMS